MISIGIDMGSVAAKAVAFDGKEIISKTILPTGWSPKETGEKILNNLIHSAGINHNQIKTIVGTGYGRVSLPFVEKRITEITCHGKGAYFLDSTIRTIIDIGGQDSKVIQIDEKGAVLDFIMNDKCAAGTGRFLQVMANALGLDVSELSNIAEGAVPQSISSMCTVFAESEIISLMAEGATKESIAAGLLQSVVTRTCSLVCKLNVQENIFFSGGVSKNPLLRDMLSKKLGMKIYYSDYAQYIGAIGAAVLGFK